MTGKPASFLAGGEFPYPTFQAGSNGIGSVTIQFREFGVRLNFTPTITPRGTIRLEVAPEVSALDFTNGLVVQGIRRPCSDYAEGGYRNRSSPAGQSFAIGGLIDNTLSETIDKIPLLGDIPVLGKLFQSKTKLKQNTELFVIITPEIVSPVSAGYPVPGMKYPQSPDWPRTIPDEATGISLSLAHRLKDTIPVETLVR